MRRPGKARSHAKIAALSHSAEFSEKNNLIRRLAAAVDEAADQQATLVHPAPAAAQPHVLRAQEELAEVDGAENVCTVPLADDDQVIGGMVLERNGTFQRHEVERLEHVAALIGPILNLKRLEDRWLGAKAWASAIELRDRLFGARYPGIKLAALSLVAAGIVLTAVDGTYRVTSDASLEGIIQRSVTAPIAGYVADSSARAGDIVTKDQVLATLDEKDFQLEKVRWISEREKYRREYSRALAQGDRGAVRVLAAQIEQADAQIRLLDEQLARTRIVAPFDGIIVSGDLSQSLSAPVERGDVLFKVAPLDSYRVVLEVDERDIAAVGEGQDGLLALTGSPGEPLSFSVEKITPVATAREGRNFFRVEGRLLDAGDALRPGMEGVAKIEVEKRSLLWIYTHKLVHWWRVWLWQVLP
jgi:multidrug efflux pump subunit AcrA (membrane-fusion protein)